MNRFYNVIEYNENKEPIKIFPVQLDKQVVTRYRFIVNSHEAVNQIIEQIGAENKNATYYEITQTETKTPDGLIIECTLTDVSAPISYVDDEE